MNAKHTPGPWVVYRPPYSRQIQIRDDAGEIIIAAVPEKDNTARALADAALLAKAPELVEALAGLLSRWLERGQSYAWPEVDAAQAILKTIDNSH